MTAKKVPMSTKPTAKSVPEVADAWVESRTDGTTEKMKRLTIDIPESLHRTIKTQCAMRGSKIVDEVRELLMKKYANTQTR